ncbi:MAG: hypothetical protein HUK15_02660, partial [Bacteroidales bacterium]|nr:hypothetical protein [Bacteroidales bacterium]
MKFYFEYSPWLFIPIALVAVALAIFLYHKDKTFVELEKWKKNLLTTLRFVFIFLTLSLLLNPIVKHIVHDIRKPIVVIAQDNSKSIVYTKDSTYYNNEYINQIEDLRSKLSSDYDVALIPFSDNIEQSDSINFSGEATNISLAFNEITSRYAGANVGTIILATDGIYNKGQNPQYSNPSKYMVSCIALGDTVTRKDLAIKDIVHNNLTFLGNKFPVRIIVAADKCSEKKAQITISRKGKTVHSQAFAVPENGTTQAIEVELPADAIGLHQYKISVQHLENEANYDNNETDFFIEVIDRRSKILLLADGPHPDVGAIKSAIKNNPDLEIDIKYSYDKNISVKNYDLVISHQLPTKTNPASEIFAEIQKHAIPNIIIVGQNTLFDAINKMDLGVSIPTEYNTFDDVTPAINNDFSSFVI